MLLFYLSIYSCIQVAGRLGVPCSAVKNVIIWGNHSSTQFPDVAHAMVTVDGKEKPVQEAINNDTWVKGDFIKVC